MIDKRHAMVRGRRMTYVEVGEGPTVVLLHGNPTSSFLWRNVWPHLADQARCVIPDLIGMGDSEKIDGEGDERYRFAVHREYLAGLLDEVVPAEDVVLVVHDWGSALGFDWANHHRDRVRGVAYMESIVRPLRWDEWPADSRATFERLRSPEGEQLILEENLFVERMFVRHPVPEADRDEYRRPFLRPGEDRRPTLTWPRQLPLDGEPADVVAAVASYAEWMAEAAMPKLFVNADPGSILVGAAREFCRTWPNQHEVTVRGGHFVQESSPHEIGSAISEWLETRVAGQVPSRPSI